MQRYAGLDFQEISSNRLQAVDKGTLYNIQFNHGWIILEAFRSNGSSSKIKTIMAHVEKILNEWKKHIVSQPRNHIKKKPNYANHNVSVQEILDFYEQL